MSGSLAVCLQVSPSCVALVSQMSPGLFSQMWFSRCCLPVAPRFLRLLSSCLSLVLEGVVSPNVYQLPSTIPICFPELVCQLSPSVFHLSPRCFPVVFQDVVSHLSPSCFAFVLQMWSSKYLGFCSRCALPILSQLSSTQPPHRPVVGSQ